MRTTLELPDKLMKKAKIAAVERGITLRKLVGAALEHELLAPPKRSSKSRHVKFPIFSSTAPGSLDLTNADIARLEAEEDHRRHGGAV